MFLKSTQIPVTESVGLKFSKFFLKAHKIAFKILQGVTIAYSITMLNQRSILKSEVTKESDMINKFTHRHDYDMNKYLRKCHGCYIFTLYLNFNI